ncbi:MAG: type IX secretion system outer membrane channel protein PorV [Flavobacteriales bacterium]|nr:type IX secretion system outer membrane channel protein PorV [Flavobacteriales bacterium]
MQNITKFFTLIAIAFVSLNANAQENNPITTAAPFLMITPDARSGAMGDVGAATTPDINSQYWNPAKYIFSESSSGIGISYTPWLNELVSDIFVGYVSGFYKINDRSAMGASMRYFGLGEIQTTDESGNPTGIINPNEFSFDVSYSLKLDDRFSMAVALRYIQSNINTNYNSGMDTSPGRSVGVDIAGYYLSKEHKYEDFDGQWSLGWNISNIGPKMSYEQNSADEYFLPTNMRLGVGYKFQFDKYNVLNVTMDLNKLLVPTPPTYNVDDEMVAGKDPNVGVISGMFQSFYDAPGAPKYGDDGKPIYKEDGTYDIESGSVFKEEMNEIAYAFGVEYVYDNTFALRGGYFHEDITKGARQYATIGFGFNYNAIGLDFSYLISTSQVKSPLENTLRFSLTLDLGSFSLLGDEEED